MSKCSQGSYTHGIPAEDDKDLRISITLRMLKGPQLMHNNNPTSLSAKSFENPLFPNNVVPNPQPVRQPKRLMHENEPNMPRSTSYTSNANEEQTINTIYISSSMFRHLNASGMSSDRQGAGVFFYPGATASQMRQRLLNDPAFKSLDKKKVSKIFILCGTNNIDGISQGTDTISNANDCISNLLYTLWSLFDNGKIHVINLLPRENQRKNAIAKQINCFLKSKCKTHGLKFIDTNTGFDPMFSFSDGSRNNSLFSQGFDNVHLNSRGYSRIARYLKYLAHIK